jgi:hypothetical protein
MLNFLSIPASLIWGGKKKTGVVMLPSTCNS